MLIRRQSVKKCPQIVLLFVCFLSSWKTLISIWLFLNKVIMKQISALMLYPNVISNSLRAMFHVSFRFPLQEKLLRINNCCMDNISEFISIN